MSVDPFSEPISKLSDAVIYVLQTTANFKPQLTQLKTTLESIDPIINDIKNLNGQLDRSPIESDIFVDKINDAKKLVLKCLKIKFNPLKKFTHSLKLKDVDDSLLRFFQIEVQADQCRDIKQTLVAVNHVSDRVASLSMDFRKLEQTVSCSSFMSVSSSSSQQSGNIERQRLGWQVPALPSGIVAFKEPLEKLKAKVLDGIDDYNSDSMDIDTDERVCNVVVVSAAGGCGKTTLVKMLCHDEEIQGKFGQNVFFVTVSETPNFMLIVNDLGLQGPFQSDEDAKNKLDNFLRAQVSRPILLVLDDVWSDSFIENFEFDISGYKVVVTSRNVFNKYDVFQFDPLSDEDAKTLFRLSARPGPVIGEDLVNQMVNCCKKHPLTLSVIGGSLAGKDKTVWIHMLKILSRGQSILDLNDQVLNRLERSFESLKDTFKQCYLDFGLFLEDQRIPASALLNMWAHLYNHDDEGVSTLAMICELSYRNLVNLTTTGLRRESSAKVNYSEPQNYCEQQYVSQHDLLRQLAIKLSSKSPIAQRPRLIISAYNDTLSTNVQGKDMPVSFEKVQEPLQARIMSISTGESFSSNWCNLDAPNVEVMVLNLMSKTYNLPHFLNQMQKMKILDVTNHGVYPTEFKNSHFLGCLSNLLRIRLERVAVSSLSTSLGALVNLQKVSFIMCNIGNGFEKLSIDKVNIWPRLVEIEMDYCQDLVEFPDIMCNSVHLKRLSITNCNELCKISEEFGKLTCLESLNLRSCTKLENLPESIVRLQNLSIIDISDCLSLSKFPEEMGNLAGLETIYMKGCTGVVELPQSVIKLSKIDVVCNEEISYQWQEFPNVKIHLVEENRLDTLMKIM